MQDGEGFHAIKIRIFDAQLMSCCNLREYLPAKKDIKEFKSIDEAQDALPPAGFGAGVFADEDNEEDVPRNAEMFEAASILSAMQVPSAGTRTPCAVECARLPASCTLFFFFAAHVCCDTHCCALLLSMRGCKLVSVYVSHACSLTLNIVCIKMFVCLTRDAFADDSHDQLRPQRGPRGRV